MSDPNNILECLDIACRWHGLDRDDYMRGIRPHKVTVFFAKYAYCSGHGITAIARFLDGPPLTIISIIHDRGKLDFPAPNIEPEENSGGFGDATSMPVSGVYPARRPLFPFEQVGAV